MKVYLITNSQNPPVELGVYTLYTTPKMAVLLTGVDPKDGSVMWEVDVPEERLLSHAGRFTSTYFVPNSPFKRVEIPRLNRKDWEMAIKKVAKLPPEIENYQAKDEETLKKWAALAALPWEDGSRARIREQKRVRVEYAYLVCVRLNWGQYAKHSYAQVLASFLDLIVAEQMEPQFDAAKDATADWGRLAEAKRKYYQLKAARDASVYQNNQLTRDTNKAWWDYLEQWRKHEHRTPSKADSARLVTVRVKMESELARLTP